MIRLCAGILWGNGTCRPCSWKGSVPGFYEEMEHVEHVHDKAQWPELLSKETSESVKTEKPLD